jgi:hypothetical protein
MMYSQLNYLVGQQRTEELHRVSERERRAASIRSERPTPAPRRRIARLRPSFTLRRSPAVAPKSA